MSRGVIISLGSVNADFQVRVERRPAVSETLLARDFVSLSGGKAANVAFLARRLGVDAVLLAHVGDDALKAQALEPLQKAGVDLSRVRAVRGSATGVSMITVPPDGKKGIVLAANANDEWDEGEAADVRGALADAPAGSVLVVDYEVPPFIVEAAVDAAVKRDLPVVLDPSPAGRVEHRLLPKVTYLVPNAGEAEALTGVSVDSAEAAEAAGRFFLDLGVRHACVKLKDGGCVLTSGETVIRVPPVPVDVVDTTGAGDAFAGALAVAVLEGRSLKDAALFAAAASHHCVTRYGSQPAYPDREELEKLLHRLGEHAHEQR